MYPNMLYVWAGYKDMEFKQLKHGFKYGNAKIERYTSDEKQGWVVLGLETSKEKLQIFVTKTGKVRIYDKNKNVWRMD